MREEEREREGGRTKYSSAKGGGGSQIFLYGYVAVGKTFLSLSLSPPSLSHGLRGLL